MLVQSGFNRQPFNWDAQRTYKSAIDHGDPSFTIRYPLPKQRSCVSQYIGHTDVVQSVHWTSACEFISASLDGSLRKWSTKNFGTCRASIRLFGARTAIYDSCMVGDKYDKLFLALSDGPLLTLVDHAIQGKIEQVYSGHGNTPIMAVDSGFTGSVLLSGSRSGRFVIHDSKSAKIIASNNVRAGQVISDVSLSPGEDNLGLVAMHKGDILLADFRTPDCISSQFPGSLGLLSSAKYADVNTIIAGGDDCIIRAFDLRKANEASMCFLGHSSGISTLTISRDKGFLLSGSTDGSVRVWSMTHGEKPRINNKQLVKFDDGVVGKGGIDEVQSLCSLTGHSQRVQCVSVNPFTTIPASSEILTASSDTSLAHFVVPLNAL